MSKETMERIREAETRADQLIAEAEAKAAAMKSEAEAKGRELCRAAEEAAAISLNHALEEAEKQAAELTAQTLETAKAEAEAVRKSAEGRRGKAENLVIGGLEAKCR